MTMDAGQVFQIYLKYRQIGGGSYIRLKWSYPGISETPVPAITTGYTTDVSLSPYQITVECPTYYSPVSGSYTQ